MMFYIYENFILIFYEKQNRNNVCYRDPGWKWKSEHNHFLEGQRAKEELRHEIAGHKREIEMETDGWRSDRDNSIFGAEKI